MKEMKKDSSKKLVINDIRKISGFMTNEISNFLTNKITIYLHKFLDVYQKSPFRRKGNFSRNSS